MDPDQTEVLTPIEQERRLSPRGARNQKLQDRIPAVSVNHKGLLDRLSELIHGVIFQESQDPNKLPESLSFFSLLSLETTAKRVKTFGQVQIHQGPGMIQGTRLSFQKAQIMAIVKEDSFLAPGSHVFGYDPVLVT
jgi:hypothetical protein